MEQSIQIAVVKADMWIEKAVLLLRASVPLIAAAFVTGLLVWGHYQCVKRK